MPTIHTLRCTVELESTGALMIEGVTVWARKRKDAKEGPRHPNSVQFIAGRDSPRSQYAPGERIVLEHEIQIEDDEDPESWEWHCITIPASRPVKVIGIRFNPAGAPLVINQGILR